MPWNCRATAVIEVSFGLHMGTTSEMIPYKDTLLVSRRTTTSNTVSPNVISRVAGTSPFPMAGQNIYALKISHHGHDMSPKWVHGGERMVQKAGVGGLTPSLVVLPLWLIHLLSEVAWGDQAVSNHLPATKNYIKNWDHIDEAEVWFLLFRHSKIADLLYVEAILDSLF